MHARGIEALRIACCLSGALHGGSHGQGTDAVHPSVVHVAVSAACDRDPAVALAGGRLLATIAMGGVEIGSQGTASSTGSASAPDPSHVGDHIALSTMPRWQGDEWPTARI